MGAPPSSGVFGGGDDVYQRALTYVHFGDMVGNFSPELVNILVELLKGVASKLLLRFVEETDETGSGGQARHDVVDGWSCLLFAGGTAMRGLKGF